ncbi:MAG: hypothetical protein AAF570_13545 [Bacteroidota bacterium]
MSEIPFTIEIKHPDGTLTRESFVRNHVKEMNVRYADLHDAYAGTVVIDDILRTDGRDDAIDGEVTLLATYAHCEVIRVLHDSAYEMPRTGPHDASEDTYIDLPIKAIFRPLRGGAMEVWG